MTNTEPAIWRLTWRHRVADPDFVERGLRAALRRTLDDVADQLDEGRLPTRDDLVGMGILDDRDDDAGVRVEDGPDGASLVAWEWATTLLPVEGLPCELVLPLDRLPGVVAGALRARDADGPLDADQVPDVVELDRMRRAMYARWPAVDTAEARPVLRGDGLTQDQRDELDRAEAILEERWCARQAEGEEAS